MSIEESKTYEPEVVEAPVAEAPKRRSRKPKEEVVVPKVKLYRAARRRLRNPYTSDIFVPDRPTKIVDVDGWLRCQIDAGLIVEYEV